MVRIKRKLWGLDGDCARGQGNVGPGFGRGNSLRAEGTGMLSIALFLGLVTEYIGHDILRVHFISDNLGLINRSRDHLTYTIPYVNATVQAEHDLIE